MRPRSSRRVIDADILSDDDNFILGELLDAPRTLPRLPRRFGAVEAPNKVLATIRTKRSG